MSNLALKEPLYLHREYNYDFPKSEETSEPPSQILRVGKVALPFIALYQPIGRLMTCGLSATRAVTKFGDCIAANNLQEFSWAILNTGFAIASVAGTIFLHPLGMLITTLSDIGMNLHLVYGALCEGEMLKAGKEAMRVANNSFYLAMLMTGSIELQLASLAVQVLVEGSSSYEEFSNDNLLEAVGHFGMCLVRMNQSYHQFDILQKKWNAKALSKLSQVNKASPQKCAAAPKKGGARNIHGLEAACGTEQKEWHPQLELLKEQHKGYLVWANIEERDDELITFAEEAGEYVIPQVKATGNGNLVAVWVDADASGLTDAHFNDIEMAVDHFENQDRFLCISYFDRSTGIWSKPSNRPLGECSFVRFLSADSAGNALIYFKDFNSEAYGSILYNNADQKWCDSVNFTGKIPSNEAIDVDEFGNCLIATLNSPNSYSIMSYDINTQTWKKLPNLSFKAPIDTDFSNFQIKRDENGAILLLTKTKTAMNDQHWACMLESDHDSEWVTTYFAEMDNEFCLHSLKSLGDGRFVGIYFTNSTNHAIYPVTFSKSDEGIVGKFDYIPINGNLSHLAIDETSKGYPLILWQEELDEDDLKELTDEMEEWLFDHVMNSSFLSSILRRLENEEITEDELEDWIFNKLMIDGSILANFKALELTKIRVAEFDPSTPDKWKTNDIASSGLITHPKFGKVDGQTHLIWSEFSAEENMKESKGKILGTKYNENTRSWDTPHELYHFTTPIDPFDLCDRPQGFNYSTLIRNNELEVIWANDKDRSEYKKEVIPLGECHIL